jgi:diguanylate cyclase (GGDEF)-like protein
MLSKRLLGLDSLRGTLRFYAMVLVCLPLILSIAFFALFQRGRILDSQAAIMLDSLRHEKTVLQYWFENIVSDLRFLASHEAVRKGDLPAIRELFTHYRQTHPTVPDVVFVDASGVIGVEFGNAPTYVGDREYFLKARQGETFISDLLISRRTGTELVTLSVPVHDAGGQFAGIVFVPFELATLDHLLANAPVGQEGSLYLADAEGRILAPAKTADDQKSRPRPGNLTRRIIEAQGKGGVLTGEGGVATLGAAVPMIEDRWFLVERRPVAAILAGYHGQIGMMLLGALASIAIVTPLLLRLARNLEQPLHRLLRFTQDLLGNRDDAILRACPADPMPAEMRALHQAFCDMAREVRDQIEEAKRLGIQDPLTGLYNRRFLFDGGTKLLEASVRAGRSCSCLMLDVDHFKLVNDTYGHKTGDQVLVHLAETIKETVRKADLVARYGGEEFAVLLTGAGREQGVVLAKRLRQVLAERPCLVEGQALPVTVSIGVAEARQEVRFGGSMLDDLLVRADRALYAAKAAGRDRVEVDD